MASIRQQVGHYFSRKGHKPEHTALELLKYIGPGLLVTVGFIDPGNWASNVSAGSAYGNTLLWMITLSTVMLIFLQHNAAHLGIATGYCLSEAAALFLPPATARLVLSTAVLASISTALAEILGAALALNMLFGIPIKIGGILAMGLVILMLWINSYRKIEKWIIGFVSLIGLSFLLELTLVKIDWPSAARGWVTPSFPKGSMPVIMSVLGAVVMPHNLFLHSEIIQSRKWNLEDEKVIKRQLKYEFGDTLFSMIIGWAINSAMILLAASTFFRGGIEVTELQQAQKLLKPIAGNAASIIFAGALLLAGISSSVTAGAAGGSIMAGVFGEPYDIRDRHSRIGVLVTLVGAGLVMFFISDPFKGLVVSQMLLSIQLPVTIFLQIYLTSSQKVMGKYANTPIDKIILWTIASLVTLLNLFLLLSVWGIV